MFNSIKEKISKFKDKIYSRNKSCDFQEEDHELVNIIEEVNINLESLNNDIIQNNKSKHQNYNDIINEYTLLEENILKKLNSYNNKRINNNYYYSDSHNKEILKTIFNNFSYYLNNLSLKKHTDNNYINKVFKSDYKKFIKITNKEANNYIKSTINKENLALKFKNNIENIIKLIENENNYDNEINKIKNQLIDDVLENIIYTKLNELNLIKKKTLPDFLTISIKENLEDQLFNVLIIDFNLFYIKENAFRNNKQYKILDSYYKQYNNNDIVLFDNKIFNSSKIKDFIKNIIMLMLNINYEILFSNKNNYNNNKNYFLEEIIETINYRLKSIVNINDILIEIEDLHNLNKSKLIYKIKNNINKLIKECLHNYIHIKEKNEEKISYFVFSLYIMLVSKENIIYCKQRKLFYYTIYTVQKNIDDDYIKSLLDLDCHLVEKLVACNEINKDYKRLDTITSKPKIDFEYIISSIQKISCINKLFEDRFINFIKYSKKETNLEKVKNLGKDINYLIKGNNNPECNCVSISQLDYVTKDNNKFKESKSNYNNKDEYYCNKTYCKNKINFIPEATALLKVKHTDNSPTITILISGFLSQDSNQLEEWNDVLKERDNSSDIYLMPWQASSYLEFGLNVINLTVNSIINKSKKQTLGGNFYEYIKDHNSFTSAFNTAKIVGKLLAYTLACRNIFGYKSINLAGYSLGCEVIKQCLCELHYIYDYLLLNNFELERKLKISNLINNILMIGGSTQINLNLSSDKNSLSLVNGRFINFWSLSDMVLTHIYKNNSYNPERAIGIEPLIYNENKNDKKEFDQINEYTNNNNNKDNTWKCNIINIDYSKDKVGHLHYRNIMLKVFKDSKILYCE